MVIGIKLLFPTKEGMQQNIINGLMTLYEELIKPLMAIAMCLLSYSMRGYSNRSLKIL